MEPIVMRPEKELKTLFFIYLSPMAIPILILLTIMLFVPGIAVIILSAVVFFLLVVTFLLALWLPAFYRSLEYVIDEDSIRENVGVFWKKRITVPYAKITNVDVVQGPVQRKFNVGSIHIQTAGASGTQQAEMVLLGIRDMDSVKDTIMARVAPKTRATGF